MHLKVILRHPRLRPGVQKLGHLIDRSREGNKNNHLGIYALGDIVAAIAAKPSEAFNSNADLIIVALDEVQFVVRNWAATV